MSFTIITLDPTNYFDALVFQENFFNAQLEKKNNGEKTSDTLIFLQHTPVYTLGKSGDINNLKIPIEDQMNIEKQDYQPRIGCGFVSLWRRQPV